MISLAVLASGGGSNAEAILRYFQFHATVQVAVIITNNPAAGVIAKAAHWQVPLELVNKTGPAPQLLAVLQQYKVQVVALAGYLRKVPQEVVAAYPGCILNIHPALLPNYGGKGMYGLQVHQAVLAANAQETGITIHTVNDEYDQGQVLFQARLAVPAGASPDALQAAVQQLEHFHYPRVIEEFCAGLLVK